MAQYTLIVGMIAQTDLKNLPKLNTLTCAFEWQGGSVELLENIGNELIRRNDSFRAGNPPQEPKMHSYRDYVEIEKNYRNSEAFKMDRMYWKEKLAMRRDFSFPGRRRSLSTACEEKGIVLREDLYSGLLSLQDQSKISMPSLLESMAALLIYRIQENTCFTFGTLNYGRVDGGSRQTMGCMMNSPPLLMEIRPEEDFITFAKRSYEENLEMLRHIRYSTLDLTPLSYGLCLTHGMNFNFNWILFSYMDFESAFQEDFPKGRMFWSETNVSQFYAAVFHLPKVREIRFELRYQKKRFQEEEINDLLVSYRYLIREVLDHPDRPMKEFLLSKEDRHYDFGDAEKKSTVQ